MTTYLIYLQKPLSLFSGGMKGGELDEKGFRKILIGDENFVGEGERGHWQLKLCEGISVMKGKLPAHFWCYKANGNDSGMWLYFIAFRRNRY